MGILYLGNIPIGYQYIPPTSYKIVEYIEGDDIAWIDTKISGNDVYGFDVKLMPIESTGDAYIGTFGVNDNADLRWFYTDGNVYFDYGNQRISIGGKNPLNMICNPRYLNNKYDVDELDIHRDTINRPSVEGPFRLPAKSKCRIYYGILYDNNGNIIFDGLPAYDPKTNEYGIYDKVSREFLRNGAGSGSFKGPDD